MRGGEILHLRRTVDLLPLLPFLCPLFFSGSSLYPDQEGEEKDGQLLDAHLGQPLSLKIEKEILKNRSLHVFNSLMLNVSTFTSSFQMLSFSHPIKLEVDLHIWSKATSFVSYIRLKPILLTHMNTVVTHLHALV